MFFVLSSGRCGSQTAAQTFRQFPNCVCLHEPEPRLVIEASEYFYGNYPRDEIVRILRETRSPTMDGKIYGESSLKLVPLVPILDELFPQCRFVWLIRDGRDTVASMYSRGWYDPAVAAQSEVHALWEKGRLRGDRAGEYTTEEWARLSRFEKCCWMWRKHNLLIESVLGELDPSRWRQVRLDRFQASLGELIEFLGLKRRHVLVEQLNPARQPVAYWESWTDQQRAHFEKMCAPQMDRWFPEWHSADGQWAPIWHEAPQRPGVFLRLERWLKLRYWWALDFWKHLTGRGDGPRPR